MIFNLFQIFCEDGLALRAAARLVVFARHLLVDFCHSLGVWGAGRGEGEGGGGGKEVGVGRGLLTLVPNSSIIILYGFMQSAMCHVCVPLTGVHCLDFSVCGTGIEQWRQEKLGKPVNRYI